MYVCMYAYTYMYTYTYKMYAWTKFASEFRTPKQATQFIPLYVRKQLDF